MSKNKVDIWNLRKKLGNFCMGCFFRTQYFMEFPGVLVRIWHPVCSVTSQKWCFGIKNSLMKLKNLCSHFSVLRVYFNARRKFWMFCPEKHYVPRILDFTIVTRWKKWFLAWSWSHQIKKIKKRIFTMFYAPMSLFWRVCLFVNNSRYFTASCGT